MVNSGFTGIATILNGSQKLYPVHHLFRCDLGRYLDQVGVMRKYYGSKLARMLQLSFVAYAAFALVINGNCLDSPAAQPCSDPHVYIFIGVDF